MLTSNLKHFFLSNISLSLLIVTQSYAAAVLEPTSEPVSVLAPYALSDTNVGDVNKPAKAYRPWFENGTWQGDLIEYSVSSGGILSTTIDSSVQPPTNSGSNWSARLQFDAAVAAAPTTYWSSVRKIIFHDGTGQKAFLHGNLTAPQKTQLSSDHLDYVRGDQSKETNKTNGTLRERYNLLGDIIHSDPVYVAAPDSSFSSLPGYSDFKTTYANRAARVYVGANDGMLHAFDASNGNEAWAYVPSMLIDKLSKLKDIPFKHNYYVDGQLSEGDMDFDNAADTYSWRSLLVGGLGSGAKGFFILDITNPTIIDPVTSTGTDIKIFKEFDGSDADIGYIHGKAQIARLDDAHTNDWAVITGNGYGSTSGEAKLILVDKDGVMTKIATDSSTNNGLSAPTLLDVNNDFDVDYAYAGDLQGNLWKFDLTKATITATKLFAAGANNPITSAPDIRRHPSSGHIIYFGTGSLLSAADAKDTALQRVYGIWDGAPAGNTTLLTQTLSTETHTYTDNGGTPDDLTDDKVVSTTVRTNTNTVMDWATYKGWQVDLNISGERLVTKPTVRADRLQFVTHNPLTGTHGDAWLMQLNVLNGGTGSGVFLDLNLDGYLNDSDKANSKIPVGINLGNGSFSGPTIARVTNSRDTLFINGLYLPLSTPCTDDCDDGFQLGHVDVDTDSPNGGSRATNDVDAYCYENGDRAAGIPVDANGLALASPYTGAYIRSSTGPGDGLGGATDGHSHEYDKEHGQVYIDYINLEPLCKQASADSGKTLGEKLNRITEVGIGNTKKFFIVISNADLSPGSDMQIGAKKWNVVVYQKMIQQKLDDWNSSATGKGNKDKAKFAQFMVDNEGASLLFTIDDIIAAGTFRHAFNDRAIADGGLLPTKTGCVKSSPYQTLADKGRWRGGALVTQAIDADAYSTDPTTLVKQSPTDLFEKRTINDVDIWLKEDNLDESVSPAVAGTDGTYDTFYGGLRARDKVDGVITANPAFLYESTLFWHYSGACYGSASWAANVKGALNSSSTNTVSTTLTSYELKLQDAKTKLQALIDAGESEKKIKKQRKLVAELEEKIEEHKGGLADDSVANTGVPTPPTDIPSNITPSLGPNFQTGRRTWIDLTP